MRVGRLGRWLIPFVVLALALWWTRAREDDAILPGEAVEHAAEPPMDAPSLRGHAPPTPVADATDEPIPTAPTSGPSANEAAPRRGPPEVVEGDATHRVRLEIPARRVLETFLVLPTGILASGVVRHAAKGPLAGITVQVNLGTGGGDGVVRTVSAEDGRYRPAGVPPGEHLISLTGEAIGFHPRPRARLRVDANDTAVHRDFVVGRVSVEGLVRDRATGRPLPGAQVGLVGLYDQTTVDGAGLFAVRDVPPGRWTLYVVRDGYQKARIDAGEVESEDSVRVDVDLDAAAAVEMVFRTPAGEPIVGDLVLAIHPLEGEGTKVGTGIAADAVGHAIHQEIVPGRYRLSVIANTRGRGEVEADVRLGDNAVYVRIE